MRCLYALMLLLTFGLLTARAGESCICTKEYDPVCSTTNKTYGNICELQCAGEELAYYGVCCGE